MTTPILLRATFGFLVSLSTATLAVSAPRIPDEFAAVKIWYGNYSYKVSGNGTEPGGKTYSYTGLFEGSFTLKQSAKHANLWTGPVDTGQGQFHYKLSVRVSPKCTETETIEGSGPTIGSDETGRDPDVELSIYPGTWSLHIMKDILPVVLVHTACDGTTLKADGAVGFPASTEEFPLPTSGITLEKSFIGSGPTGGVIPWTISAKAEWQGDLHLSPTPDDFVLELSTPDQPDYNHWQPSATATGDDGGPLSVKATLTRKSGAPAGVEVSRMEWELVNTSREPGIAINFPNYAADSHVDMHFEPKAGQQSLDEEHQQLVSTTVKNGTDTVSIRPTDWGGWSTLRVTAYIRGGPKVVGTLKATGEKEMRLPKRRSQSFIADAWRDEMKNQGKDASGGDSSDDEKDKAHGGYAGDGLSLYEEYRGYYAKGKHESGDPGKRELFVRDKTNGFVEGGLKKFEKETGIVIHRLDENEFNLASRVVNRNRSSCPHAVDQHGVLVVWIDSTLHELSASGAYMATVPTNGEHARSPGEVQYIIVPKTPAAGRAAPDGTAYQDVSFAHEMMHAVGVRHHGTGDKSVYWKVVGDAVMEYGLNDNGSLKGPGEPITILNPEGNNVTPVWISRHQTPDPTTGRQGQSQEVGVKNGEHSGDDTCMMRYDRAGAFMLEGDPSSRVLVQEGKNPESIGYRICTSPAGTGINAPPAFASRYGDAQQGNCAAQIRVSDRY